MRGIEKAFAGVPVLRGVDLELAHGEVVALVGENGAGKSTLIKILSGLYSADAGTIELDGRAVAVHSPGDAEALGVQVVHQDRHLAGRLTVAEQLFLGRERGLLLSSGRRRRAAESLLRELVGLDLRGDTLVDELTVAEQQLLQIARALLREPRVLVLDEPTAPLAAEEVELLFAAIRRLQEKDVAVIYISHYLQEVRQIASRAVVLRNGAVSGEVDLRAGTLDDVVHLMVGREVEEFGSRRTRTIAPDVAPALRVNGLVLPGALDGVTLEVRPGEVVGVTGLVGSGVEVLADAITAVVPRAGIVETAGRRVRSPRAFVAAGGAYVPSDRRRDGVLVRHTVRENLSLAALARISLGGVIPLRARDRALAEEQIATLDIRPPRPEAVVGTLSGGNQQKVVLGKWLAARAQVFVLDQPTAGVDIGSRAAIYARINELVANGAAVLLVTLDLEELVGLADRAIVLHRGRVRAELSGADLTSDRVLELAADARIDEEPRPALDPIGVAS